MAMHKFYEALCKLVYRVGAVLFCGLIVTFPVAAIMELSDCSFLEAAKFVFLAACVLALCLVLVFMAVKGYEIIKREKMMQTLLIMDISPDKLLFAFYRLNRKGEAVCLTKGERASVDAGLNIEITSAVDENCNITDPVRLAVLYHRLFRDSGANTRRIYECECNRAAVRLHTSEDVSEAQKQNIEKMLSSFNYSMFSAESIGSTEQRYLSADEAYAEYGDWSKAAPCSE